MLSPAAIYQYVSEATADSGFERQQRLLKSVKAYYLVYENYVKGEVGRIIPANVAILFLWNILFFVAAHYVFVKRSLR
jgi:ABC-type transport system involved in multi-copper enzyme maturation permease subunit